MNQPDAHERNKRKCTKQMQKQKTQKHKTNADNGNKKK